MDILIVDTSKSGLVMTSEVFKDALSGSVITTCATGLECLEKVKKSSFHMVVVDFDLPDTDGVTLTKLLRPYFSGPILITAFPEAIVKKAISDELFFCVDSSMWIEKPVKFDALAQRIEYFLIENRRLHKRFIASTKATVSSATKKGIKVEGKVINLSSGGALLEIKDKNGLKAGDKIWIELHAEKGKKSKKVAFPGISRVKAQVAWTDKKQAKAGIQFEKLSKIHEEELYSWLRQAEEYE